MFGSSRAGASLVFICNPLRITCAAASMAAGDWFTDKYMVLCATPYKDAPFQSMLLATAERMCHCPEMFVRPHIVVHPSGNCLYIMAELELPREFCGFDMTTRPWYVIFARAVCDHGAMPNGEVRHHIRQTAKSMMDLAAREVMGDLIRVSWVKPHQSTRTGTTHVRVRPSCQFATVAARILSMARDVLKDMGLIPTSCEWIEPNLHMQLHPYKADYADWLRRQREAERAPPPPPPAHHPELADLLPPLIDLID